MGYASEVTRAAEKTYRDSFGNPDSNVIYLEGMDFLSPDGIEVLREVEDLIEEHVPMLSSTYSLFNLLPPSVASLDLEMMEWLEKRVLESPSVFGRLISKDRQKALIVLNMKDFPKDAPNSPYLQVGRGLEQVIREFSGAGRDIKIFSNGTAHLIYQQYQFYFDDVGKIFITMSLIALLLIFLIVRSWLAFFATVLNCIVSNWIVIGLIYAAGYTIQIAYIMIPVSLCVATSIGYSVHMYNYFRHSIKGSTVEMTLGVIWLRCYKPLTFTMFTTAFSMLSLYLIPIESVQVTGYASFLVVIFAYLFTMIYVPLILSFTKDRPRTPVPDSKPKRNLSHFLDVLIERALQKGRLVLAFSLLFFGISLFYVFQIKTNYNFVDFVGPQNTLIQDLVYLEKQDFIPVGTVNAVIEVPEGEIIRSIDQLRELDRVLEQIEAEEGILHSSSINMLIKSAMLSKENDPEKLFPESLARLNGLLRLIPRISGFDPYSWISKEGDKINLVLSMQTFDSNLILHLVEKYEPVLERIFPGSEVFFTGFLVDTSRGNEVMTYSFLRSIGVSILIVFLLMFMIFRRILVTLVSLVPNVLPILWVGGLLSYWEISLNSFTLMLFPMFIGLAVDDTIHFFYHVIKRFDSSNNYSIAIRQAVSQVGPSIVQTSIILVSIFSVLTVSSFRSLALSGYFAIITIILALLVDIILGPILLWRIPERFLHLPKARKNLELKKD